MKTKLFCIFLLCLEISRGNCNVEYNVNEQLQISANILQVYNRDLDNSIKWKELKNVNLNLTVEYHTDETIFRMGKIRELINGAADSYFESSHEIYDWTSNVISKLTTFENLKRRNRIIGRLIVDISQKGKEKAEKSIEKLLIVRQKFANASVECKNIIPYFDIDQLKKSDRFQAKIGEIRLYGHLGTFGGAAFLGSIGAVLGTLLLPGLGTLIAGVALGVTSQVVGSVVTEAVFVEEVAQELVKVQNYFKILYPRIDKAAGLIDDVVKGVKDEINRVTDLKNEAESVIIVVEDNLKKNISLVDDNVKKLLDQCNEYKLVHST
ncbi:hemolysin E-like isoform X1 [Drosophila biarmipes]|uniref:hemolysin E-like isoform X1 n=1 Tax=Drosophila biarmipes TaxID=125945 RepID=UPI0021CC78FB|nr:hemolysin E-like isoform X1 [Drosophila biarmipes]